MWYNSIKIQNASSFLSFSNPTGYPPHGETHLHFEFYMQKEPWAKMNLDDDQDISGPLNSQFWLKGIRTYMQSFCTIALKYRSFIENAHFLFCFALLYLFPTLGWTQAFMGVAITQVSSLNICHPHDIPHIFMWSRILYRCILSSQAIFYIFMFLRIIYFFAFLNYILSDILRFL